MLSLFVEHGGVSLKNKIARFARDAISEYIEEAGSSPNLQRIQGKFADETYVAIMLRRGAIDLVFCLPGAIAVTVVFYSLVVIYYPALLLVLVPFEAIPGLGGVSSVFRALYFLTTLTAPAFINSPGKGLRAFPVSFVTSFDGGWVISPFVRAAMNDPELLRILSWKARKSMFKFFIGLRSRIFANKE